MKEKILNLLKEKGKIYLMDLLKLMPEIKGEKAVTINNAIIKNPNIFIISGVNDEFIDIYIDLILNNIVCFNVLSALDVLFDSKPILSLPFCTPDMTKTEEKCFLPIEISLAS